MFNIIEIFEKEIAKFYNAPYAVATDSCTHAIELSLLHTKTNFAVCPKYTYLSVPMTFIKLGINWEFVDKGWVNYYYITENIIDSAVYWKENGYIKDTFMCLSFQYKKHLSLGRGGAILCTNKHDYISLKKLCYDGRLPDIPWKDQNIDSIGYHYYMTPETAEIGINKLKEIKYQPAKIWSNNDYPDLTKMKVFNNVK